MSKSRKQLIEKIKETQKEIEILSKKNDKRIQEMMPKFSIKELREILTYAELELYDLEEELKNV